eukprot:CAMPEP_0113885264 /NCGR_PEP_ID=MMETSP0780_2-20120614/10801_1 /TAXON_ID=652834 /ORGANISM="Palpitomonas bilix" /LENGTH=262 /DNA_ID=CAMNT_0000873145 /DNA_START=533 /DNA_END=1321 /DNA_ORIENTATION=- /assembly_acc=CAM_ASM_000599
MFGQPPKFLFGPQGGLGGPFYMSPPFVYGQDGMPIQRQPTVASSSQQNPAQLASKKRLAEDYQGDEDGEAVEPMAKKRRRTYYSGDIPQYDFVHLIRKSVNQLRDLAEEAIGPDGRIVEHIPRRVYKELLGKSVVSYMDRTFPSSVWLAYYRQRYVLEPESEDLYQLYKQKLFPKGLGKKVTNLESNQESALILSSVRKHLRKDFDAMDSSSKDYKKFEEIAENNKTFVAEYLRRGIIKSLEYLRNKRGIPLEFITEPKSEE